MQIVNPFNRVPETEEELARSCHCVCHDGSSWTSSGTWLPTGADDCGCNCIKDNNDNKTTNFGEAAKQVYS